MATEKDRRLFSKLAKLDPAGTILLVGAGPSAMLKSPRYPTWTELVDGLERLAPAHTREALPELLKNDYLWRMEHYRQAMPRAKYTAFLRSKFKPCLRASELHHFLVELGFKHYFTTNYDDALEQAFVERRRGRPEHLSWDTPEAVANFLSGFDTGNARHPKVVHLHGVYTDLEQIVLTDRDYARQYMTSDRLVRSLFSVFAMNRVLFLGFSLTDPELTWLLRTVNAVIGFERPRHHALLSVPDGVRADQLEPLRDRHEKRFGVRPIFYHPDPQSGHGILCALLEGFGDFGARAAERIRGEKRETLRLPLKTTATRVAPRRPAVAGGTRLPPSVRRAIKRVLYDTRPAKNDDPRKGRFGRKHRQNGLELRARVALDSPGWYRIDLTVASEIEADPPRGGEVVFYYHNTFDPPYERVSLNQLGEAKTTLYAYGAFTVGVVADKGKTALELDLSLLKSAPLAFRQN